MEFVGQLKNLDANNGNNTDVEGTQNMLISTILEKIKEKRLKFSK